MNENEKLLLKRGKFRTSKKLESVAKGKYVDSETGEIIYKKYKSHEKKFINDNDKVYVTIAGHHVEVCSVNGKEIEPPKIKKISKTQYVNLENGEVNDFNLSDNRSQNADSFRKTMKRLRGIIKSNFFGQANELFITLTYRGELQTDDYKSINKDVKNFIQRLRRNCASSRKKRLYQSLPVSDEIEYINVLEPHESGNFHCHILIKFKDLKSVYIPNHVNWENGIGESVDSPLRELWGMGNVSIKSLKGNDDIGAYLSAYMTDLEVPDTYNKMNDRLVEKEVEGKKKKYIKGGRIAFYPTGMKLYSSSSGIVEPVKEVVSFKEIKKVVGSAKPHYQSELSLEKDEKLTTIKHIQYNLKRQGKKYKGLKNAYKEIKIDKS